MSIHDYVLDNQTGANFRTDLNNNLQAIVSNNSSATEPTTTYSYMWWADTTNDLLKQRNAANDGWISILTLSTGVPVGGENLPVGNITSGKIHLGGNLYLQWNRRVGDLTANTCHTITFNTAFTPIYNCTVTAQASAGITSYPVTICSLSNTAVGVRVNSDAPVISNVYTQAIGLITS